MFRICLLEKAAWILSLVIAFESLSSSVETATTNTKHLLERVSADLRSTYEPLDMMLQALISAC